MGQNNIKKINWKQTKISFFVELDTVFKKNNICSFNTKNKIMTIPDKSEDNLKFNCDNLEFAEIILYRFLEARKLKLKKDYYV